jgi:phage FluMu gp28-like protein
MNNQQQKISLKELIRREFQKCAVDPIYFIKKYCMIQTQNKGRILFDLYPYQEDCIETIQSNDNTIILKGRQIGISTVVACYALWLMLFQQDKNVLVIATRQDTAKNLVTKVRFAFDCLPIWLQIPCIENNKLSLKFNNGSEIKAISSGEDAGRSFSASLLILDEAAFIDKVEHIWTAAQATLATGGKAVLLSSPNGIGNFFWQKYIQAEEYKNNKSPTLNRDGIFFPIKLDWRCHPERDERWREKQRATLNERQFRQEHEAEFLGSGNTVFDADLIEYFRTQTVKSPTLNFGPDSNGWVWEQPDYSRAYVVVADVARGENSEEGDYSACHVLDLGTETDPTCTQVAEYRGRLPTTDFGHLLISVATQYNDALLVVENSTVGWATIQTIIDRGYKNLFYMTEDMKYFNPDEIRSNKYYQKEKKAVAGFTTSSRTRPLIISKLDEYMRDKAVQIKSQRVIDEMQTFVWHNGKPQAQEGFHDDLIMSLCIGLWIRDTALQLRQRGIELTRTALDGVKRIQNYDGIMISNRFTPDPYKINIAGKEQDLRWLL